MIKLIKQLIYEKNIASLGSSVIAAVLGLVGFLILTRTLKQSEFGDWVLYTALASFTDLLRFGLTRTAVVRFISGTGQKEKQTYLATSFWINVVLVAAIAILFWGLLLILRDTQEKLNHGYMLFLKWYPLLATVNLSWNNALSLFQAEQRFFRMLWVQSINLGSFVIFLLVNYLVLHWTFTDIILAHLGANLLASIYCMVRQYDGLTYLKKASREARNNLFHFGKFSMGTLIGSSLLRSADTFIIGLSPVLGSTAIAMYAIPMKLTDLLGIPLRGFSMAAFPKLSVLSKNGDMDAFRKTFYSYAGVITLLFIPLALLCYLFANQLILFLGGSQYRDSMPLLVSIFRIFTFYTLLMPYDRFTGVALNSLNEPRYNLYKVVVMAVANILGDLVGVFVFHSLEFVALVTVLFTITGIWLGNRYLTKLIQIQITPVFTETIYFLRDLKLYLINNRNGGI